MNRQQRRSKASHNTKSNGKAAAQSIGNPSGIYQQALACQQAGRLADAEVLAHRVLSMDGRHADSLHLLGVIALQSGRPALASEKIALAIQINPQVAVFYFNLGIAWQSQDRYAEAVDSYEQAIRLKPDYAEAFCNIGTIEHIQGKLEEAIVRYRQALAVNLNYVDARYNLGSALQDLNRVAEAIICYEGVIATQPDYVEAHINLGTLQHSQGRLVEAMCTYQRALTIQPDCAQALSNLGSVFQAMGRLDEAMAHYKAALAVQPDYPDAHFNLGTVLQKNRQLTAAIAHFERALALQPDHAEALCGLASARHSQGDLATAAALYEKAWASGPEALEYAFMAQLLLPKIPASTRAIAEWRQRFKAGLQSLLNRPPSCRKALAAPYPSPRLKLNAFYLAYHDDDDRQLMVSLSQLCRSTFPGLTFTAPHVNRGPASWQGGPRIRIGFISEYFSNHTIGKLYQGFIRKLDRSRFEVILIHAPESTRDAFSSGLDAEADRCIWLSGGLQDQQNTVAALELDVAVYPDIGMSPATYFLAYARLAPVQVVSWGHPDTTGLDTMDYFLSAAAIEAPGAEAQYNEQLIRLNRLPCFYVPPDTLPIAAPDRFSFGLPATGALYCCPQSLFKFHPQFDAILAGIALGDPDGHIVLLDGHEAAWIHLLKTRWANTYPLLAERVIFLPRLSTERFLSLMALVDVLLDPIHFGSGNTFYEAMMFGTPIVTWPGRFMRGRIVAGGYQQMGLNAAPIAQNADDYVQIALTLGLQPQLRADFRATARQRAQQTLFSDRQAVQEFEKFLLAAVNAAYQGQKLPQAWQP